jgi:outer membrane protein assembly factor BamB
LIIARVDADSHATRWVTPIPAFWGSTVFTMSGYVWVLATAPNKRGPVEVNTLYKLDPESGVLVDEISVPESVWAPVIAGDTVWWRSDEGVQRLDPSTGLILSEPIRPVPGCCTGPFVGDGTGGAWVISSAGAGRAISHIDASGRVVETGTFESRDDFEAASGQSYAFDPATGTIWVQHYEDSVSRIEVGTPPSP